MTAIEAIRKNEREALRQANLRAEASRERAEESKRAQEQQLHQKVLELSEEFYRQRDLAVARLQENNYRDGQVMPVVVSYQERRHLLFGWYDRLIIEERAVWNLIPETYASRESIWLSSEGELLVLHTPRKNDFSDFLRQKGSGTWTYDYQLQVVSPFFYFDRYKKDAPLFEQVISAVRSLAVS